MPGWLVTMLTSAGTLILTLIITLIFNKLVAVPKELKKQKELVKCINLYFILMCVKYLTNTLLYSLWDLLYKNLYYSFIFNLIIGTIPIS